MMTFLRKFYRICLTIVEVITDWFLILMGAIICAKAIFGVDLPTMKYTLAAIGCALSGCGFWYRYKRLRKR